MNTFKKNGKRVTVELDELDCELIASALKVATATRKVGRKVVTNLMGRANQKTMDALGPIAERFTTPIHDQREADLIALFERMYTE